jgi:hypothetical protein
MADAPRNLAKKLVEIMAAVKRIPKNGWNEFHKYHYAMEADIVEALRDELAQRNVLLLPAITGRSREAVGEKGQVVTHIEMEFTFIDADTGEAITRPWLGAGADKEDKGAYKAMTGGEKTFLLKTFMIPTGDDPEAEEVQQKPKPAPQAVTRPVTRQVTTYPVTRHAPAGETHSAPEGDGLVKVANVTEKQGQNERGPWTLYIVKFSDGREATTFDDKLADRAREAQRRAVAIRPAITPGKGDKLTLTGLFAATA